MDGDEDELGGREDLGDERVPPSRAEPWTVRRSGPSARLVVAAVLAILLIVFAALNFRPVRVNFLLFTTRARVVTVIGVAALLGFVVGWFVGRPGRRERRHLREWHAASKHDDDERRAG